MSETIVLVPLEPVARTSDEPLRLVPVPSVTGDGTTPSLGRKSTQPLFFVLTADEQGKRLSAEPNVETAAQHQDPHDERARDIELHFNRKLGVPATPEQMDFVDDTEKLVHVLAHLYPRGDASAEAKFRRCYVKVFSMARLVLQDGMVPPGLGKAELAGFGRGLLHDDGARVKNQHIGQLVRSAGLLAIPFAVAYVLFSLAAANPRGGFSTFLGQLHIDPATAASYMLVWLGAFLGVCISYTVRKRQFTVDDLVAATEDDLLVPVARLVFAGTLTMVLVMFAALTILDVSAGPLKLAEAVTPNKQLHAFAIGVVCGVSEMLLPSRITPLIGGQPK